MNREQLAEELDRQIDAIRAQIKSTKR